MKTEIFVREPQYMKITVSTSLIKRLSLIASESKKTVSEVLEELAWTGILRSASPSTPQEDRT